MTIDLSSWHVIVVDDEPDNVGVIKLVFEFNDIEFSVAESGKACLKIVEKFVPDLMLIDIQMPEMTGYQLLEILREKPKLNDVPMIAITAHAMSGDQERIMAAGFTGYIAKPINVTTLIEDIKGIISK